jgi:hypothetical protein
MWTTSIDRTAPVTHNHLDAALAAVLDHAALAAA